jgi:hypothetical protein
VSLNKPIGSKYFLTELKAGIFGIEPNGSLFQGVSYGPKIRLYPSRKSTRPPAPDAGSDSLALKTSQRKSKTRKANAQENANFI